MTEALVAYNPRFDRDAYKVVVPENKERLNHYTQRQLETHLGERFNVVLSTTRYEIRDGQIFGQDTNEPFMQMLQRGINYRKENGNPIDFAREEAELVGFEKIEKDLTGKDAVVGEMRLSISPPSGSYEHNFYDIFTLCEDEEGRFIEARRYSSALSASETVKLLSEKRLTDYSGSVTPDYLLSHPIAIEAGDNSFKSADDIHQFLHRDHDFATEEEFDEVKRLTAFLAISYIESLLQEPIDELDQLLHFNAYLNAGDMALDIIHSRKSKHFKDHKFGLAFQTKSEIYALGMQPVRIVATGCGSSGGFNVNGINKTMSSPFSISEFASKGDKKEWFTCPKCSYKADGPVGNQCPSCHLTKEDFAENGGEIC